MPYKKLLLIPLTLLSLSTFSLATIYSDGEDGTVDAWSVYDNSPEGATISNVSDETRTSQVIEFKGKGRSNAYLLGKKDWNNRSEHYLKWSMNFSEKFKITLYLKTAHGYRVIYYDYKSYDKGFYHKKYIKIGLGSRSMSGTWQSFTRDVEADLKQYDPSNSLIAIKGLKVQGSGRIDDVRLEKEGETSGTETPCISRKALRSKILNGEDVTKVNTSCIKDMSWLFEYSPHFNQDISGWDVSHVTTMAGMFLVKGGSGFNVDISDWNVSNVTDMNRMFADDTKFNQDISKWDVSHVMDMTLMLADTSSFNNHDLSNWNVEHVKSHTGFLEDSGTNNIAPKWKYKEKVPCIDREVLIDKIRMGEDVTDVNTSCITDMSNLFYVQDTFNQDIGNWDVSNVTNMEDMFNGAKSFNQDLSKWDVSKVTNMKSMFYFAKEFNQDLSRWDVSKVTNMNSMFNNAHSFNQPLNSWNVSNVTDMYKMFKAAASFNQPLNNWNVSNVKNMGEMFGQMYGKTIFNQPINNWDVSNVTNMQAMFYNDKNFKNHDLSNWNVKNVTQHSDFLTGTGENNIEPNWGN